MSDDRVLLLEGVHNFRDYGGYPVAGGGRLKRGMLWRSGQHFGATDSDLSRIGALGLASVFDLRGSKERASHPCRRPEGFTAEIHYCADPEFAHAPHLSAARATPRQRDAASTRASMLRNYGAIAFRPELLAMVRRMIAALAAGEGACLVNCMAGKDRTGIAVAAVHIATGVHRDDILADYVLTNSAGDQEARLRAGAEAIRAVTGQIDEDVLRVLMGVEPEYLETAFATMEERCGSIDGWLERELGLDGPARERLRAALVE